MLTGAAPAAHGITSNLVLKLGLKVESVFDVLRRAGKRGRLVGIAHLIDAFGDDVASVTSVAHNDKIDQNLIAAARREIETYEPELLVLQLLAVDQNGHVRGTAYPEYVERIEITDRFIEGFMLWCEDSGYLEDAAVILMADHGQGKGIGAHGHLSEGERFVPFAMWGSGVKAPRPSGSPTPSWTSRRPSATCSASNLPRVRPGGCSKTPWRGAGEPHRRRRTGKDEGATIGALLDGISEVSVPGHDPLPDSRGRRLDGRHRRHSGGRGAEVVVHPENRGLGAAVRTGLRAAVASGAVAVAYLDADLEYSPGDIPRLLEPVLAAGPNTSLAAAFLGGCAG
jgi:glycosyltransferase involved in cell wall biosynthesis